MLVLATIRYLSFVKTLQILCPIYKGDLVKGSSEGRLCGIPLSSTNESLVVCSSAIEVQFLLMNATV